MTAARGRPGRRPLVDRDSVLAAVVEQGFGTVTVSSVAQRLGIRPSTLYRYFANRDEMVAAAVETCFARVPQQAEGHGWRARLASGAWGLWGVYAAHPGLAEAVVVQPTSPPALAIRMDRMAVRLLESGFQPIDAVLAVDVIGELALDTFLLGRITTGPRADGTGALTARRGRIEAATPLLDPRLRGPIEHAVVCSPRAWFGRKLDLVLDGLTDRAPAPAPGTQVSDTPICAKPVPPTPTPGTHVPATPATYEPACDTHAPETRVPETQAPGTPPTGESASSPPDASGTATTGTATTGTATTGTATTGTATTGTATTGTATTGTATTGTATTGTNAAGKATPAKATRATPTTGTDATAPGVPDQAAPPPR
ncbi:TetR/AcrR family transcriptional regulator [Streptomyces uncialis]|uniref:TetR/AcrR family transcriptional regulator n=1 Tax=Streptomyces uncialis TaxID=1048205 RepID=UPI00093C9B26|nr:TetR/AcrR family transcriptional regulator [Streptomyces uncialis]